MSLRQCVLATGAAALVCVAASSAAGTNTARLQGRFATVLTITKVIGAPNVKAGRSGIGTWTFRPNCADGACVTALERPTGQAGSTAVFVRKLVPGQNGEYDGQSQPVLTACVLPNGKRVPNSYRTTQTIVLHAITVSGGRVISYAGTQDTFGSTTPAGRAHGCLHGTEQLASFRSTGHH